MIDKKVIFDDFSQNHALWCAAETDSGELARCVDIMGKNNIDLISVVPSAVKTVWPWLEETGAKIMARFYLGEGGVSESNISDMTKRINKAFKYGAHGAQVFLPYAMFADLVEQTHVIRDDLFFNKDLSIGLDINEIDSFDWDNVFDLLRKINASSLLLFMGKDDGNKSDFTGRIYGMLDMWQDNNKFDLHFVFGAKIMRIEQVGRLVQSLRPDLMKNTRFFVAA